MGQDEKKLEGLQAARAIAALSVAYFHSYIALRGFPEHAMRPIPLFKTWGYLGVDFFFAISGYVICVVASRPTFSAASFAAKRFFRLFPMYWATMLVVAWLILNEKWPDPVDLKHYIYSLSLLPQSGAPAYSVSWSMERELVFYALAALLIPIAGIPGLAIVLVVLAAAGYYFNDPWSFHLISIRHADFLGGVIVFLLSKKLRVGSAISAAALAVGIFGIGYLWMYPERIFPFAITLSLSAVLFGMVTIKLPWSHPSLYWLVLIGDASYSLYLVHGLLFYYAPAFAPPPGYLPDWFCEPFRFLMLAAACAISYLTWRIIERPMIVLGNRLLKPSALPAIAPEAKVT